MLHCTALVLESKSCIWNPYFFGCLVIEYDTFTRSGTVKTAVPSLGILAHSPVPATHTGHSNMRWQGKHSSSAKHLSCTAPGNLVTEIAQMLYLESPRAPYGESQTTYCGNCTSCEIDSSPQHTNSVCYTYNCIRILWLERGEYASLF
jgi:hypothetical protein